jgi:hypothetical protein
MGVAIAQRGAISRTSRAPPVGGQDSVRRGAADRGQRREAAGTAAH